MAHQPTPAQQRATNKRLLKKLAAQHRDEWDRREQLASALHPCATCDKVPTALNLPDFYEEFQRLNGTGVRAVEHRVTCRQCRDAERNRRKSDASPTDDVLFLLKHDRTNTTPKVRR